MKPMNKKAVEWGAGVTIVILIFYFIMVIFISYAVDDLDTGLSTNYSNNGQYSSLLDEAQGQVVSYCTSPRYKYNDDGSADEMTIFERSTLRCSETYALFDAALCLNIEGCTWANVTCTWWEANVLGCTDYEVCSGTINASYYGINTSSRNGEEVVSRYDYDNILPGTLELAVTWLQRSSLEDNDVCVHPEVLGNETLCNLFSCTWTTEVINSGGFIESGAQILRITSNIFLFGYNDLFQFSSSTLNLILYFIFILIPLLLLIIAIYNSLPFI